METPLTPLEFQRRALALYPDRECVIDGGTRLTYEQFFARCDRWSAALQRLGVRKGDRVAYISLNTHSHLESFYAVPQTGAVLVPINFRLNSEEIEYIVRHCGAKVVCAHADFLETVESIRGSCPDVEHCVALEGGRDGWLDYEQLMAAETGDVDRPDVDERDLLTINYTSGTTSRPKGVMITHRNAYMNAIGTLVHVPMTCRDRYLWTLPMFHANGWTFPWIVTAVGGVHICLRKVDPVQAFGLIRDERVTMLCAAPTVLIGLAGCPTEHRGEVPAGVRVLTAGAPPAAATIQRVEGDVGAIQKVWNAIITGAGRDVIALVSLFGVAMSIDALWTLIALVGVPLLILPAKLLLRHGKRQVFARWQGRPVPAVPSPRGSHASQRSVPRSQSPRAAIHHKTHFRGDVLVRLGCSASRRH